MDLLELQGVWFDAPTNVEEPPPAPPGGGAGIGQWLLRGVGRSWWIPLLLWGL